MTLDGETRALLERLGEDRRLFPETPPALAVHRQNIASLLSDYAEAARPVGEVTDQAVDGPGGPVPVRRYRPEQPPALADAAILFLHGGGWSLGDLDCYDSLCRNICALSGLPVYSVAYRLAPEHPFPAGLEDVTAVFDQVKQREGAGRVIAMGDSAGGNLAAALSLKMTLERCPGPDVLALFYPMTDVSRGVEYPSRTLFGRGDMFLAEDMIEGAAVAYLTEETGRDLPLVSPLLVANAEVFPPTLVVTAGHDPLRDEGRAFEERLRQAGVRTVFLEYESTIHGFLSFDGLLSVARRALPEIISETLRLL